MDDKQIFSWELTVSKNDIDQLNHVNNVVYVQWIQDVAVKHWFNVAPDQIRDNYVWVVVRHEIDYKRPAQLNDELVVVTKVLDAGTVTSNRQVQFFRKKDNLLMVEAKTTWCMIDAKTFRPARIPDIIKTIFLGDDKK